MSQEEQKSKGGPQNTAQVLQMYHSSQHFLRQAHERVRADDTTSTMSLIMQTTGPSATANEVTLSTTEYDSEDRALLSGIAREHRSNIGANIGAIYAQNQKTSQEHQGSKILIADGDADSSASDLPKVGRMASRNASNMAAQTLDVQALHVQPRLESSMTQSRMVLNASQQLGSQERADMLRSLDNLQSFHTHASSIQQSPQLTDEEGPEMLHLATQDRQLGIAGKEQKVKRVVGATNGANSRQMQTLSSIEMGQSQAEAILGGGLYPQDAVATMQSSTVIDQSGVSSLEDTAHAKQLAEVDLSHIERERSDKLASILNSNIQQRKQEFSQAEQTFSRQKARVDQIQSHLSEIQAEIEALADSERAREALIRDKEQMLNLQRKRLQDQYAHEATQMQSYLTRSNERKRRLEAERSQLLQHQERQDQVKESLNGRLQALKNHESELLQNEVRQLKSEEASTLSQIEDLKKAQQTLKSFVSQQFEQTLMLDEDMQSSASLEQWLVMKREDLENYSYHLRQSCLPGVCKWSQTLQKAFEAGHDEQVLQCVVEAQTRQLVVDLIRELQQYMLGQASGTTDQSTLQSSALEDIEEGLEEGRVGIEQALGQVVSFASDNFNLDLSQDQLRTKMQSIQQAINLDQIKTLLHPIRAIQGQIEKVHHSINQIQGRISTELVPLSRTLTETNQVLDGEQRRTEEAMGVLQAKHRQTEKLIALSRDTFMKKPEGLQLHSQIKQLLGEIKQVEEATQQAQYQVEGIGQEVENAEEEIVSMQGKIKSLAETTKVQSDQIKDQIQNLRTIEDPQVASHLNQDRQKLSQLRELEEKLRYELQSAQNRLSYASQKVKGAQESLYHAKGVLQDQQSPDPIEVDRKSQNGARLRQIQSVSASQSLLHQPPKNRLKSNQSPPLPTVQGSLLKAQRHSVSQVSLREVAQTPNPITSGKDSIQVAPGLLTSIVKQVRRSTRTQNRIDLAELLRKSVQQQSQGEGQVAGDQQKLQAERLRVQGIPRAYSQLNQEGEHLVDTERLMANRKDKTLRLAKMMPHQMPRGDSRRSQTQIQSYLSGYATTALASGRPSNQTQNHRMVATPALAAKHELDKSASIANFQSAEQPNGGRLSSQAARERGNQNSNSTNPMTTTASHVGPLVTNFRNESGTAVQEEQGCARLSTSQIRLIAESRESEEGGRPKGTQNADLPEMHNVSQIGFNQKQDTNSKAISPVKKVESPTLDQQHQRQGQATLIPASSRLKQARRCSQGQLDVPQNGQKISSSFNMKKLSQATSQSMSVMNSQNHHQSEIFNPRGFNTSAAGQPKKVKHMANISISHQLKASFEQSTVSSRTKTQRRSQQRNQIKQKYSTVVENPDVYNSVVLAATQQELIKPAVKTYRKSNKGTTLESGKVHSMLSTSSRSGFLSSSQSNSMVLASSNHSKSLSQFKQLASYPKRMTLTMNKVSGRPAGSLRRASVNLRDAREEEFFKSVRPLVAGAAFIVAMDSGCHVEQHVYLNLDLLSLHIESANQSTCAEVISVAQLFKTELPAATLEQIRVYQKSPQEVSKASGLHYEFNLHVLETSPQTNTSSLMSSPDSKPPRKPSQQYRVKLAAKTYPQLKEWIVGLNSIIKEKNGLSRYAAQVGDLAE